MESQLNGPGPEIHWIEATSQNRLELIEKRAADMECGATTVTLKRRFVDAKVVAHPSREAAVAALETEQADAFAIDKVLLDRAHRRADATVTGLVPRRPHSGLIGAQPDRVRNSSAAVRRPATTVPPRGRSVRELGPQTPHIL